MFGQTMCTGPANVVRVRSGSLADNFGSGSDLKPFDIGMVHPFIASPCAAAMAGTARAVEMTPRVARTRSIGVVRRLDGRTREVVPERITKVLPVSPRPER